MEDHKKSKKEVQYEPVGMPQSHCGPTAGWSRGECAHYIEPNNCEKVAGHISPKAWCKLWQTKNG